MSLSAWVIIVMVFSPVWLYVVARLVSRAVKRTIDENRFDRKD